ncbi:MAG: DUF6335 family protein [Vicinamibacteria bacterium]
MARAVARKHRRRLAPGDGDERHASSATAVAAEALRTGIVPGRSLSRVRHEIPREDDLLRAGDPDDSGLLNEYVGEDLPGGSTPTPDQNQVDAIGRVYGLQDEDAGELHTSSELLARRDRHRQELRPPRRSR